MGKLGDTWRWVETTTKTNETDQGMEKHAGLLDKTRRTEKHWLNTQELMGKMTWNNTIVVTPQY